MTVSLIGGHFRNNGIEPGYPSRVCLSINGNGLDEQHPDTIVLFRDVTVYNERPSDLFTHPDARTMPFAQYWYDRLRPIWQANKHRAHYFTITNEIGGSDPEHIKTHIAYESNICQLAAADGLKCAVGKLAGDSPNWPSGLWESLYVPFIVEMWETFGAIYARHVYGGGNLVDGNGNPTSDPPGSPARAIQEVNVLRSMGYTGGMVLAECGLDGGYGVADYGRFQTQATGYAAALKPHADIIIGVCWWDCGSNPPFSADYTAHLKRMRPVLDVSLPKWTAATPPTPPTDDCGQGDYKSVVWLIPQEVDGNYWEQIAKKAHDTYKRTITASDRNARVMACDGNNESYVAVWEPEYPSQKAAIDMLEAAGITYQLDYLSGNPPPPFAFTHWPTNNRTVTQEFGANPQIYGQYGLPGHEGADIRAARSSPIYAVANGTVHSIHPSPAGHNYGIHVRIDHQDDNQTIYGHLESISAGIVPGLAIVGGQQIGKADNTGNSSGDHLHLTYKRLGHTYTDPSGNVWPSNIHDPTPYLATFSGVTWPGGSPGIPPTPPTGQTYDMSRYLFGKRDGRALQLSSGETVQYQEAGGFVYCVKNSQWEQFRYDGSYIWRGKDTSPGPAPSYAERPGQLRYYWQKETGQNAARWCPRYMTVGQVWTGFGHFCQYFYKADCALSSANTGNATNKATLIAHHTTKTWGNLTVHDVLEFKGVGDEHFWLILDWGMGGWSAEWGESHVTELFQPGQRTLVREQGCFG